MNLGQGISFMNVGQGISQVPKRKNKGIRNIQFI